MAITVTKGVVYIWIAKHVGHLQTTALKSELLEAKPVISSFLQDFTEKAPSDFPMPSEDLPTAVTLNVELS